MKRESVLEKLQSIEDNNFDDFVDWLMDENGSDVNNVKKRLSESNSDINELKKRIKELEDLNEEAEKAKLTKEQLVEKQLKELADKKAELDTQSNRISAKAKMVEAGLSEDECEKLLERVVSSDSDLTAASVDAVLEVLKTQREATEAATKKSLLDSTPHPKGGSSDGAITKESWAKMSYKEQLEVIEANPDILNQLG